MQKDRLGLIVTFLEKNNLKNKEYVAYSIYKKNEKIQNVTNTLHIIEVPFEIKNNPKNFREIRKFSIIETNIFNQQQLVLVNKINENYVFLLNENFQKIKVNTKEFLSLQNKVICLKPTFVGNYLFITIFLLLIGYFILKTSYNPYTTFIVFTISLIGLIISVKSYIIENKFNDSDLWFCTLSRLTNCNNLLRADKKFPFTILSPTDLSAIYFLFFLICCVFNFVSNVAVFLFSLFTLLAIPLSLYYQYSKKTICTLCMSVILLVLCIFFILWSQTEEKQLSKNSFVLIVVTILTALFIWKMASEHIKKYFNFKLSEKRYLNLITNRNIFKTLTDASKLFPIDALYTTIIIGNVHAENKISIFLDLFCDVCKDEYEYLRNNYKTIDAQISIHFLFQNSDYTIINYVKNIYFMCLNKNENDILEIIDKWYIENDFYYFSNEVHSPFNYIKESELYHEMAIYKSPSIFLNNNKVNSIYSLKNVFFFLQNH